MWSSTCAPGETFGNYLGHLMPGCHLVNDATDWFAAVVRAAANGIRTARKAVFKFPNYLYSKHIFQIISTLCWGDSIAPDYHSLSFRPSSSTRGLTTEAGF